MARRLPAAFAVLAAAALLNGCSRHQTYVDPYPAYYGGVYETDGATYWEDGQETHLSTMPAEDGYEAGSSIYWDASPSYYTEQAQYENDGTYWEDTDQGAYLSTLPEETVYETGSGAYWNASPSVVTVPDYSAQPYTYTAPQPRYVPPASPSYSASSSSFFRMPSPVSAEYCRAFLASYEQERRRRALSGR